MEKFGLKQERSPEWYRDTAWYKETTGNEEFKNWFEGSVVLDREKEPLPMFHFTPRDFEEFDIRFADLGIHFGSLSAVDDRIDELHRNNGIDSDQRIIPVFLKIQKPLRTDDLLFFGAPPSMEKIRRMVGDSPQERMISYFRKKLGIRPSYSLESMEEIRRLLINKGYDGLVYANKHEDKGSDSYMVVDEEQIWYALSNKPAVRPDYSKNSVALEPESDMNFDIPELDHE